MENKNIKSLVLVHKNLYSADIKKEDIILFHEDEEIIKIKLKNGYEYEESGIRVWETIEPFDKDEISNIRLEMTDESVRNIVVPFKDISSNGAFCVNSKSKRYDDDFSATIEWEK